MYYAYHIDFIPEALTAKYPNHAVYGTQAVFGESLKTLTGIAITIDSKEIELTEAEGRLLHDDWLASQPQTDL